MKITYKNIGKYQQMQIPKLIAKAQEFLKSIYGKQHFEGIEYIFSSNYCRSRYFRNEIKDGKYKSPTVCISNRNTLFLYRMKTLQLTNHEINCGGIIQMECALVHELTHHIQYNKNTPKSELETTRNEVGYLKEYYPFWHQRLYH